LNEEATLPTVLAAIPRQIDGVDTVEVVVVDDGSTDRTINVARAAGVRHIVRHPRNMGLARSFRDGVDYALARGADIVVNTDGDNQYPQASIPELIAPILRGEAEIVVGDRQTGTIAHFSPFKKAMQWFGSRVVSAAAGTRLPDAASGFRAYSRGALLRLHLITKFSYTMETIIQAGNKGLPITSIPIVTNPKTRESRLFRSVGHHMMKSAQAIIRSYIMYKPYVVFVTMGAFLGITGLVPFVRFLYLWSQGTSDGNVQSLIFGSALLFGALLCFVLLVIADLQRSNRALVEETLERVKELQYPSGDRGGK
jgi:glycosyltransferase involved in cell wall biosynthesis